MVRRIDEGFKAGAKENRMLSKIYSVYNAIEHSNDLHKHGLSLSDYRAFPDVFKQLQNIGYAETFVKSLADFFKKNGFGVSMDDDGVNYVITFDSGVRESRRPKTNKKSMKEVYVSDSDEGFIEVWDVNENEISGEVCDAIGEAVGYIDSGNGYPTWKWEIGSGEGGTYYLVLGFAPGFDPNEDEYTDSYGSHLALKWGILSNNSAMAEYDYDFEMPYDPETGDVWDSEQAIYSDSPNIVASDVKDVLNSFYEYAKQVNESAYGEDFDDDFDDEDFDEDDLEYESIRLKRESTNRRRPKKQ